jgi:hypothetical protein
VWPSPNSRYADRKANWSRDNRRASASIEALPLLLPEACLGEIDQIVAAATHHGLQHVEGEAFGHLDRDAGRNRKHHPAHDRVDQNRSVVRERIGDALVDVSRILELDPAHA